MSQSRSPKPSLVGWSATLTSSGRTSWNPPPKQEGSSPQPGLLKGVLRIYFEDGRMATRAVHVPRRVRSDLSFQDKARRRRCGPVHAGWFAKHGRSEAQPLSWLPVGSFVEISGHAITLAPTLTYAIPGGRIIRKVLSVNDFSIDRPYSKRAAAGYLAHAEANYGPNVVKRVDFWHLRKGRMQSWRPESLSYPRFELVMLLDRVSSATSGADDPAAA